MATKDENLAVFEALEWIGPVGDDDALVIEDIEGLLDRLAAVGRQLLAERGAEAHA